MSSSNIVTPKRVAKSAVAVAVATVLATAATAQETTVLAEIVVTATKRESDLQAIPLSVTAIGGELIKDLQMVNVRDLDKTVPGLKVRYTGADPTIIMRGAGAAGTNDIAVPIYLDGLYQPRAGMALASYLDTERIEVLRGPQGTLFGRNTLGGLVNIIARKPDTEKFEYGASATVGNYSQRKFEGFVNIPMGETVALRVAASNTFRDPLIENIFNHKAGMRDEDNTYARAQLKFAPTDSFDITLSGVYWRDRSNGNADYAGIILGIPVNPLTGLTDGMNGVLQPRQGILASQVGLSWPPSGGRSQAGVWGEDPAASLNPDVYKITNDFTPLRRIDETSFSAVVNWDFGPVALRAVLGAFDYEERRLTDSDLSANPTSWAQLNPGVTPGASNGPGYWQQCWSGPYCGLAAGQGTNSKAYQADVNLNSTGEGSLQWTLGFFYYDDSRPGDTHSEFVWGYTDAANPQDVSWAHWLYQGNGGTKSTAIYGQAEYSFTDKTRATVGARRSSDKRNFYNKYVDWGPSVHGYASGYYAAHLLDPGSRFDSWPKYVETAQSEAGKQSGKASHVDWKVALQHDVADDVMLYASAATGYIAGSIEGGGSTKLTDPNEVDTYEIGMKSMLLDRSMRLNLDVYYADYKGLSTSSFVAQGQTIVAVNTVSGAMTAKGLEAELAWEPTDSLSLVAGLAFTDATLDKFSRTVLNRVFRSGGDLEIRPPSLPDGAPCDQTCSQVYILDKKKAAFSPDYTLSLDVSYDIPLGGSGRIVPGVYMYTSAATKTNNIPFPFTKQDAYTTFDLRATWYAPGGSLSVQAFMLNATGQTVMVGGDQFSQGRAVGDFNDPRTYGLRIGYNF
jgi:iron complex outermembrane receptor protein